MVPLPEADRARGWGTLLRAHSENAEGPAHSLMVERNEHRQAAGWQMDPRDTCFLRQDTPVPYTLSFLSRSRCLEELEINGKFKWEKMDLSNLLGAETERTPAIYQLPVISALKTCTLYETETVAGQLWFFCSLFSITQHVKPFL